MLFLLLPLQITTSKGVILIYSMTQRTNLVIDVVNTWAIVGHPVLS